MTHYRLTDQTKTLPDGITVVHRIALTKDCAWGKAGTLGGWVESAENLQDDAWVADEAMVWGKARVWSDARVGGNARVLGNAWVWGNAQVYGDAQVYGNVRVYGDAWIGGNTKLSEGYHNTSTKAQRLTMFLDKLQ